MTNKQKIYFIIAERKTVSLQDLYDIAPMTRYNVLSAVSKLVIKRKVSAKSLDGVRYFTIINKGLNGK